MLELIHVSKIFQTSEIETHALQDINLKINKGQFVSIMGPSGCGKSTLLNVMGLLDEPSSGIINIDNTNFNNLNDSKKATFRNQKLGFIFQNFHLIPTLNVLDNVELPLLYRKKKFRNKQAEILLEKVGLEHRMKHFPNQLSGGQCQRVAIARALIGEPEIIFADEPTGNLDSATSQEIMQILLNLNSEGTTIIMVTHDAKLATQTGRIIKLLDGKIIQ